jgi:primosomal protein N' (replication factor Y)
VVFNAALGPLDYKVPAHLDVQPGQVVICPLGPRQILGVVWEEDRLPEADVPEPSCARSWACCRCRRSARRCAG